MGKDNKNKLIKLRVSDAEYHALTTKARIAGLTMSEYLRRCGLDKSLSSVGCEQIRQFQRALGQLAEELGGFCAILADANTSANASTSISLGERANAAARLMQRVVEINRLTKPCSATPQSPSDYRSHTCLI